MSDKEPVTALDQLNAERSFRKGLRDYRNALERLEEAASKAQKARYSLVGAMEKMEAGSFFGTSQGDALVRVFALLKEKLREVSIETPWNALCDARRLVKLFRTENDK